MDDLLKRKIRDEIEDMVHEIEGSTTVILDTIGMSSILKYVLKYIGKYDIDVVLSNLKHKAWVLFRTKTLDELRMLEYLQENIDDIKLEDLENIKNKK